MLSPHTPVYLAVSSSGSLSHRDKNVTRRMLRSRRDALDPLRRNAASERIAEQVCALLNNCATVALYAPIGSEVDTSAIDNQLRRAGIAIVYPRVSDGTTVLDFHQARPEQLVASRFGLREPVPQTHTLVELAAIEAFVVPGLAFDRGGWRIGWGRGHYDATLAAARSDALRIGIGFDCQVIDDLPREPHDARLDYVVTELTNYKAS